MDESNRDFETIRARPAKSGRVSYGDTVVLRDSSKGRVVFIPFFVPHSDHTELALKLVTYIKRDPRLTGRLWKTSPYRSESKQLANS